MGWKTAGLDLPTKDDKVILSNSKINDVKKLVVRKPWPCYHCKELIKSGEEAIKQAVSTPRGGGGSYYIYLHPKCCIVKIRVEEGNRVRFKEIEL